MPVMTLKIWVVEFLCYTNMVKIIKKDWYTLK